LHDVASTLTCLTVCDVPSCDGLFCCICVQISDVDERSALIVLFPPHFSRPEIDIDPAEFQYELFLSENKDSKFSLVYR